MKKIEFDSDAGNQLLKQIQELQKSGSHCAAALLWRYASKSNWVTEEINIEYNNKKRTFFVYLRGRSSKKKELMGMFSSQIQLVIADSSRCECGNKLSLGDHKIELIGEEFILSGTFYCDNCLSKFEAKNSLNKNQISSWAGLPNSQQINMVINEDNLTSEISETVDSLYKKISKGSVEEVIDNLKDIVFHIKDDEIIRLWAKVSYQYNNWKRSENLNIKNNHELELENSKTIELLFYLITRIKEKIT